MFKLKRGYGDGAMSQLTDHATPRSRQKRFGSQAECVSILTPCIKIVLFFQLEIDRLIANLN